MEKQFERKTDNLTQLFDNHDDKDDKKKLQFVKMFSDLSYKNTGLKSAEQQMLALFVDRMQTSFATGHFDRVEKRYYIQMCNTEIANITGDNPSTVSSKLKHLSKLGYIDIARVKNRSSKIYLNFYHTGSITQNNDLEFHFYLPSDSKIQYWKLENPKAEIRKSNTNHSTYPYLLYPEGNTNRTGTFTQNVSSSNSNSNLNNKSSKAKNEQKNDNLDSSQKQKQSQLENATKNSSSKNQVDIVTNKKLKMQQWIPKDSLETITTFVKERYNSQEAQVDVLGKICDKVLNAKDKASINNKAYKVLRWERNPYLVKEVNNKMHYWLTTAIMNSKKSWWGYFYRSLKNCFSSFVEEALSDKAPEPSKHSKNQKGSNGRKHIQEKIPHWAKPGYKAPTGGINSERKAELKEKLNKIDNPKNESKDNKEPKVHNQDKGDFEITPEMIAKANGSDETSNDTSKNDKSPSEALADIGLE